MQTNEFRVRPVTRFVLTHFQSDEASRSSSSRQIGEFLNVETAEEVGVALQALVPGSTLETIEGRQAAYPPKALAAAMAVRQPEVLEYVLVQRDFAVETRAYYCETEESALELKHKVQAQFGTEFRIFSRPVTDPMRLAHRALSTPA